MRRFGVLLVSLTVLGLAGATSPAVATDWSMYGFNLQRTGENPFESVLTPATVAGLHTLWTFDLGAVTIMQPVVTASSTPLGCNRKPRF